MAAKKAAKKKVAKKATRKPAKKAATKKVEAQLRPLTQTPMGFGGCFNDLSLLEGDFREHFVAPLVRDARRMRGCSCTCAR